MIKGTFCHSCAYSALAIGLAAFAPAHAIAQETVERPFEEEVINEPGPISDADTTIVVTGSLIRGTPEDSALPVDVFSTSELAQEGVTSPLDFIKDIPAVGSVLGDSNQFSTAAQGLGGVGSINLRNLGPVRTLVLLNGHRTLVSPGDGLVDTNLLPLFALSRVELLKDGAAVTYGSDAVAGVANFITRDDFDGIEIQGDYRFIDDSDGDWTASILAGRNLGSDVNVMAGFGYRHRSPLATFDRDYSNLPYEINPAGYSVVSNPATYFPAIRPTGPIRDNPNATVRPTVVAGTPFQDAGCDALGGTQVFSGGTTPFCAYQFTDYNNLVEEQDFYQAFAQVNADLSDSVRFNGDVLWARSVTRTFLSASYPSTTGPAGPGTQFNYFVPSNNPGFADFVDQTGFPTSVPLPLGPGGAAVNVPNGAAILLYRPFALGGNPLSERPFGNESYGKNNSWRISAGLEFDMSDSLLASLQGTYIQSSSSALTPDYLPVRLQNALDGLGGPDCNVATGTAGQGGCQFFNPFSNAIAINQIGGQVNPNYTGPADRANANDAELIDWIFGNTGTIQQERNFVVDGLIAGDFGEFELGAGPILFGIGAQYRSTDFESRGRNDEGLFLNDPAINPCPVLGDMTCAVQTGPFAFLGQSRNIGVSSSVYAVFGEVQVPVLDTLEINLALRYEDYGGLTGSTLDPKASFRFEPSPWLVLRGSASTTFRGPLPSNLAPSTITALQAIDAANGGFLSVDITGDPALSPESAFTYNVGAVVNVGGFNASIDYWSYDFEDAIATQDENAIASSVIPTVGGLADCSSPIADRLTFSGGCVQGVTTGAQLARIQTFIVNSAPIKTDGIDLQADYVMFFGQAAVTVGAAATWTLNYDVDPQIVSGVQISDAYDAVGFANFDRTPGTISEWKGNAFVNLNLGDLNARYVFRYASGVTDDRCPVDAPCFVSTYGTSFGDPTTETDFGREIPSLGQHDLTVIYDLEFRSAEVQLQGSIENITDEDPPEARFELGYNPFTGNPLGRTFRLGAKLRF